MVVLDAGKDRNVFAPAIQSQVSALVDRVGAETASAGTTDAPYDASIQTDIQRCRRY